MLISEEVAGYTKGAKIERVKVVAFPPSSIFQFKNYLNFIFHTCVCIHIYIYKYKYILLKLIIYIYIYIYSILVYCRKFNTAAVLLIGSISLMSYIK